MYVMQGFNFFSVNAVPHEHNGGNNPFGHFGGHGNPGNHLLHVSSHNQGHELDTHRQNPTDHRTQPTNNELLPTDHGLPTELKPTDVTIIDNTSLQTEQTTPPTDIEIPLEFQSFRRQEYETWWRDFHAELTDCGVRHVPPLNPKFRVIGGHITTVDSYPWMVSMYSNLILQPWCAGTLIASQWVVTAAHCFLGPFANINFWTLHMGKNNASGSAEYADEQIRTIESVSIHPEFDEVARDFAFNNDIALVKLDKPIHFNFHTSPLCLVRSSDHVTENLMEDRKCTITGYGITNVTDVQHEINVLHEATIPILDKTTCQELPGYEDKVTDNMICAGFDMGAVDSCKGDSGGPLQCEIAGRWYHVGVTSWGGKDYKGCAAPHEPGVYTDVSKYTDWIYTNIFNDQRTFI